MFTIPMTQYELCMLKEREKLPRPPAEVAFSCNAYTEVWPDAITGWHKEHEKDYCQGEIPVLDDIVAMMLVVRPEGGRSSSTRKVFIIGRTTPAKNASFDLHIADAL